MLLPCGSASCARRAQAVGPGSCHLRGHARLEERPQAICCIFGSIRARADVHHPAASRISTPARNLHLKGRGGGLNGVGDGSSFIFFAEDHLRSGAPILLKRVIIGLSQYTVSPV
jgi:hypothetical protein